MRRLSLMVARRARRCDHRDFERWCLRIETAADTKSAPESGDDDEENVRGFGNREQKMDFRTFIRKAMNVSRTSVEQIVYTSSVRRKSKEMGWASKVGGIGLLSVIGLGPI